MAGKIEINRITNANIYVNGNSLLGRAEEIKLPDISAIMQEHKALGMVGKIELQCRSSIETYGAQGRIQEVSLVTFLTVIFKKNPLGTYKQHDNAEFGSSFSATYIKQVVDGEEVLELDYLANIFRVGGEDMMANYRTNIGG